MENIKVIDIDFGKSKVNSNKKKMSKKQLYKEILSSSDRVKDIINKKKKTRTFDILVQKLQPHLRCLTSASPQPHHMQNLN